MMLSDDKKDTRVSSYYRTSIILKYDENMLQTDMNDSLYTYLFIRKLIIKRFICFDKGATMILVASNCY